MSTIRMSPEFIATIETGAVVRVAKGGAPVGSKVRRAWLEDGGVEGHPATFCVEVDDGMAGDRCVVFERVGVPTHTPQHLADYEEAERIGDRLRGRGS